MDVDEARLAKLMRRCGELSSELVDDQLWAVADDTQNVEK